MDPLSTYLPKDMLNEVYKYYNPFLEAHKKKMRRIIEEFHEIRIFRLKSLYIKELGVGYKSSFTKQGLYRFYNCQVSLNKQTEMYTRNYTPFIIHVMGYLKNIHKKLHKRKMKRVFFQFKI